MTEERSSRREDYRPPTLTALGAFREFTLGSGATFPDNCALTVGAQQTDPCKVQAGKTVG